MNLDVRTMSVLGGFLAALVVLFIYTIVKPEKVSAYERLYGRGQGSFVKQYRYSSSRFGSFYKNTLRRFISESVLADFARLIGMNTELVENQIRAAGMSDSISVIEVLAMKMLAVVALGAGIALFIITKVIYFLLIGMFAAFVLYLLPESKIKEAIEKKKGTIEAALPRFIEQTYLCISAGTTLEEALRTIAEVTPGELGDMFKTAFTNSMYSGAWDKELVKVALASNVEPFQDFVNDVVIANQTGANIEQTLRDEVDHINIVNRARVMGMIKSLGSKLSPLQIILCMVPMMGIIMFPIFIEIMEAFNG